ncbi:NETI motif-containing protein [Mesobacillus subterraneus]|uniref:NETI motif-containing protein n=1 Tax=Mesobacillus subterraneus TaxID=285983 RepID=UPI0020416FA0|nr:NETI motif-containing protein [Mesobacillus subterraneus]MCM3667304.1 NETI motif-containing protein [Mesobacillus subterraneus]MCM3686283.1 NETI motif-containing protein [Mesobacillus subterraneus]
MSKEKKKKMYEVGENESIDDCLNRMKKDGYAPVRRMEKPIFQEVKRNGTVEYEPAGRQIIFETRPIEE